MDRTVQHIYGLYTAILNSTSWRLLQRVQKVRQHILPRGGTLDRLLHYALRGMRILRTEGGRAFLRSLREFGTSVLKREQVHLQTIETDVPRVAPSVLIKDGLLCPSPAISILWLKDSRDAVLNERALLQWAKAQTCSATLEVIAWEKDAGIAYRLDQPNERWTAQEARGLLPLLRGRYLCLASDDLLSQSTTYLESNLIALESESLAFTVNLRGQCDWALQRLGQGYLPGNVELPLLRQVWRKEYLQDDFSADLSSWLVDRRGFPRIAGKVIIHTTNLTDAESNLPFERQLSEGDWTLNGRYLLLRSKSELPWQSTAHTLHPVNTVLRASRAEVAPGEVESSELPTVILVMPFLAVGGAERLAINTIRYLKDKIRFVVVALEPLDRSLGTTADEFHQVAEATYQFADFLDANLNLSMMDYLMEKFQPQTLYIANGATWIYNALHEIRRKYPSLRIVNQVYDHRVGWINRYDLSLAMDIDAHIGANPNICKAYMDLGVASQRVHFIEHGIDPDEVNPAAYSPQTKQVIRNRLGLPPEGKVVAFVARLHPQKRPMDFVELARRFSSDSAVTFLMVGDGPLAAQVEAEVNRLGLKNFRRLPFYRPISDIYALADVIVLPSEYEAMPLVIAEAQAMGKPVVVTDVGNNREVVEMTGGGVVVPRVGDIAALMEGVRRMLDSPPDPERVRQAILSRFGIEVIAEQYRKVLLGTGDA
jgi:glycosyltransferase involved in cell wall biosynthesis